MKTTLIINIDTEKTPKIQLSKPETIDNPKNFEEAQKMIIEDINCIVETLSFLIGVAEDNKYLNGNETLTKIIIRLNKDLK